MSKVNLIQKIFSVTNTDRHKVITVLGFKIKFKKEKSIVVKTSCKSNNFTKGSLLDILARITPKPYLTNFTVDICDHCNLNCRGCSHFSPLAEPNFYDLNEYEKDMSRLSELTGGGNVDRIGIMGGEPLLNPDVLKYLAIARKYFPYTMIRLVTNGILLPVQTDNFWQTLSQLNIVIEYTEYNLNLDFAKIDSQIQKFNVPVHVYRGQQNKNNIIKTLWKMPLDLTGNQDSIKNFMDCFLANECIALKHGRLYTCAIAPSIETFNKYFNKNIQLTEYDGIDIYKATNIKEILEFLAKPIPFCKYCKVKGRTQGNPYGISKREIEEWV